MYVYKIRILALPPLEPSRLCSLCRATDYSGNYARILAASQWPTCIIGSRDYCHASLGVSSFSLSIQNVWEMTTVVYKIACHSCTTCPPAIALRLPIADTISSATVYRQCVKALRTRQKHGEFYCHDCGTASRPNKNRLTQFILRQLAKMMFPGFNCTAGPTQFLG